MHELALAEGIVAVVLDVAGGQKVGRVYLQVGKLLMVVPDSLRFSFQLVADGTPAAEAVLQIEEVSACWRCKQCRTKSPLDLPPFCCQSCGAYEVESVSGDELMVDAIELENGMTIRRRVIPADVILEEHLIEHERCDDEEHAGDGSQRKRKGA